MEEKSTLDWLKWTIALLLVFAGLVINHYYSQVSVWLRILSGIAVVAISLFLMSKTMKGKWVISFIRDSRAELKKVIWPKREETIQTTWVVALMVIVLALLLWGMDGVLIWLIGWLTGQRS
jgi:preprotein translocase subunit SecE